MASVRAAATLLWVGGYEGTVRSVPPRDISPPMLPKGPFLYASYIMGGTVARLASPVVQRKADGEQPDHTPRQPSIRSNLFDPSPLPETVSAQ